MFNKICTIVALLIGGVCILGAVNAYLDERPLKGEENQIGTYMPVVKVEMRYDGKIESTLYRMDTRTGRVYPAY